MTTEEKEKYYKLACTHTSIDKCVSMDKYFNIPDDYPFMERVERELGVKHAGNFRGYVCEWGIEKAIDMLQTGDGPPCAYCC